ncbi:DNA-binding XRE family transcriptional regulator [Nitrobacteraceae bacterium AZCC 2146]
MDLWGFKKWRRKLGYTQVEAGGKLGLSRGAVQYWESEIRPVPLAVELACQELLRLWKQRSEFGPVILLCTDYADDPISTSASVVRSEQHPDNKSALESAARQRETMTRFIAFIMEDDGTVVWSGPALLREIDAQKNASVDEKASAAKAPSSR